MKRLLLDKLIAWKEQTKRKPLLIDGARQTGKTFLLKELLGREFTRVLRVDFLENPALADAFAGSLTPDDVISNIALKLQGKEWNFVQFLGDRPSVPLTKRMRRLQNSLRGH